MRVQVLVVGFNRSLSSTIDSIFENVLKPARALRATTKISFVLSSTRDAIDNPRSGEQGQPEQQIPRGYRFNKAVEWDQHDIDLATEELFVLAKQNGNPWPKDDFLSLRNVIRFLYLLDKAYTAVDRRAEWVVFLRPDLLCLDPIDYASHFMHSDGAIVTPSWHQFRGHNDRVAIIHRSAVAGYFQRFNKVREFLETGQPLHAETFLAYSLREYPVLPVMSERFQRVRLGGRLHDEDFSL